MSPGSSERKRNAESAELGVPDARQVVQRGLARAVRAPRRVRRHGGVARDVQRPRRRPSPGRRGERAEQRLRQSKRSDDVGGQRQLEIFAVGVGEQRERHRTEARGVVDQDVEAAELADDLQRDRMDIVLERDVADDAVRAAMSAATARRGRRSRATKATRAPRRCSSRTRARPRPDVPPVTATRRPWSSERVMRPPGAIPTPVPA